MNALCGFGQVIISQPQLDILKMGMGVIYLSGIFEGRHKDFCNALCPFKELYILLVLLYQPPETYLYKAAEVTGRMHNMPPASLSTLVRDFVRQCKPAVLALEAH